MIDAVTTADPAMALTALVSATTRTPDPNSVTPGVAGFLVVFVLALATWLLMRSMTGRLRRMRFREQERQADQASPPAGEDPSPGSRPQVQGSGDRPNPRDRPTS